MTSPAGPLDDPTAQALARALGSQYDIVRLLGRGGMGAVYLAREPFLERDVAVKVLPAEMASGDARERFLREARTAARLSHPNIVPLYTFGQAGDLLYYVMGFVDGESLEARLRREGRLPPEDTRRITSELADALEYAHQGGVVHRDIKPDNVLLDRVTGRAMLTDFGIAKQRAALETLTQTGVIVGTPHYMSPEQASGDRDLDGRSDIYSLGVMAYRMATGRLPFEGNALREVLVQHATRDPIPPTRIIPSLPLDLDTVITRALAKEPAQRWFSARVLRDALSPDSEESTPEKLRAITGMGTRLLLIGAGLTQLGLFAKIFAWFGWGWPVVWALGGLGVLAQLIGVTATFSPAKRFGWRATLAHYFRQPSAWSGWFPRLGRRPGDVWDRLPRDLWRLRVFATANAVLNLAMVNGMFATMMHHLNEYDPSAMDRYFIWIALPVIGASLGITIGGYYFFRKRARALGLSEQDAQRAMSEPTSNASFWSRPHIAALLRPATAAQATRGETPAEILEAIERCARDGAASPHAALYDEARQAAAQIAAAIARCDDELGQLVRDADPRERERIEASLSALGAKTQDSVAKTQMRELLERQLQLLRELDTRRELVGERRAHLQEQLRTLALHVAALRASADASATGEITGRIRDVMREVDYRLAGAAEVRSVLER